MDDKAKFRAKCPECVGDRNCIIIGETERRWSHENDYGSMDWGTQYRLLQCQGCDTVFFQSKSWDSENLDYSYNSKGETVITAIYTFDTYPELKEHRPQWIEEVGGVDYQLYQILNEMYQAYYKESYILASIGLRTAFDRTSEILKILPDLPLETKVKKLAEGGFIGETEKSQLMIVTEAGNAAVHRAWSPTKSEFKSLLAITEDFIRRSVLRDESIYKLAGRIPARKKTKGNTVKEIPDFKVGPDKNCE